MAAPVIAQPIHSSGTVRVVVPDPAGGAAGLVALILAEKRKDALGQPVIFDNRRGAAADPGTDLVAKPANLKII